MPCAHAAESIGCRVGEAVPAVVIGARRVRKRSVRIERRACRGPGPSPSQTSGSPDSDDPTRSRRCRSASCLPASTRCRCPATSAPTSHWLGTSVFTVKCRSPPRADGPIRHARIVRRRSTEAPDRLAAARRSGRPAASARSDPTATCDTSSVKVMTSGLAGSVSGFSLGDRRDRDVHLLTEERVAGRRVRPRDRPLDNRAPSPAIGVVTLVSIGSVTVAVPPVVTVAAGAHGLRGDLGDGR